MLAAHFARRNETTTFSTLAGYSHVSTLVRSCRVFGRHYDSGEPRLRNEVRDSLSPSARFGATPVQHPSRGSRPGMPMPRHLQSSVGEVIFGGNAWVTESRRRQLQTWSSGRQAATLQRQQRRRLQSIALMQSCLHLPDLTGRGSPGGVGGAKLHEVGTASLHLPCSWECLSMQSADR